MVSEEDGSEEQEEEDVSEIAADVDINISTSVKGSRSSDMSVNGEEGVYNRADDSDTILKEIRRIMRCMRVARRGRMYAGPDDLSNGCCDADVDRVLEMVCRIMDEGGTVSFFFRFSFCLDFSFIVPLTRLTLLNNRRRRKRTRNILACIRVRIRGSRFTPSQ